MFEISRVVFEVFLFGAQSVEGVDLGSALLAGTMRQDLVQVLDIF